MKYLLVLLLLAGIAGPSFGQTKAQLLADTLRLPVDATTQRITYAAVVSQSAASAAELYTRGKLWFATPAYAGRVLLRAAEPEAGVLQGTGWREVRLLVNSTWYFPKLLYTVKVAVKEGRYRYEVTDFRFESAPVFTLEAPAEPLAAETYVQATRPRKTELKLAQDARQALAKASAELLASLQAGMGKATTGDAW